jgi:hypothetical protein
MNLCNIGWILSYLSLLISSACSDIRPSRDVFDNNKIEQSRGADSTVVKHRDGDIVKYTTALKGTDEYSLEIETMYIYDSLFLADNWVSDLNEVVISQLLTFKLKDSIIRKQFHDVKTRVVRKSIGNVSLLDNVIREVGIVEGRKGSFYKISGAGGCNACSEYLGYYSMQGKLLSKIYSSRMDRFSYTTGDIDKVIKQFEVPENIQKPGKLKVISVFPPQYNGEIEESSLK